MIQRSTSAAQYIRMSTDTQNLSPALQKEALREYAYGAGFSIIESYEDEARSGLTLRNRPQMQRLLRDVASKECPYSVVLVYDVSRWGRFQDTDESAYYEYHCRMNGVEVVYVKEPFEAGRTPFGTLLKALKRAMAAEFSRELAAKVVEAQRRTVSLGFQIGRVPAIGIDRVGVSPTGIRRSLNKDERPHKGERVVWVPGPQEEIKLVRRIFRDYVGTDATIASLVRTLNSEGHTARGRPFTQTIVKCLLTAEIFYGEFTWGRRKSGAKSQRRKDTDPALVRQPGILHPIISKAIWRSAQVKRKQWAHDHTRTKASLLEDLRRAIEKNPGLTATDITAYGCAPIGTYRDEFGSMREAMRLAGRSEAELDRNYRERKSNTHSLTKRFKRDILDLLTREGVDCSVNGNEQVLHVRKQLRVRFKLIWQREHRHGPKWHFQRGNSPEFDVVLLVLMRADHTAQEMLLLTPKDFEDLCTWFLPNESLHARRITSAQELVAALR